MRHHLRCAFGIQFHLADCEGATHLDEPAPGNDGRVGGRFAQEVDGEAGGSRERDNPDRAKDGCVQRLVGGCHEDGPRYRAARAQVRGANLPTHRGTAVPDRDDAASGLREGLGEERRDCVF